MPYLGVNIDHVATLRQARGTSYPDVLDACRIVEKAGADGITAHLREDRRHIQYKDMIGLRRIVKTKLNMEMAISPEIVGIALKIKPDEVCLVPEKRQELTTEGGLDIAGQERRIGKVVERLKKRGILVSLFIDPIHRQVAASRRVGADCVELHTGRYADAEGRTRKMGELDRIRKAGELAVSLGLKFNAGHGLNYKNVRLVARLHGLSDLNIGHSIISRSVFIGLEEAVREMKKLVKC